MHRKTATVVLFLGLIAVVVSIASYAQQHDHAEHNNGARASTDDEVAIFCPTMKTGQLCSHGTANVLGLTGAKQEKWLEIARKYDRSVRSEERRVGKE